MRDLFARLRLDTVRQLHADEIGGLVTVRIERPVELLVANDKAVNRVERLENVFARTQSERPEEDRAQKLALAVNADVKHVFLVVLELNPRSPVGNDLAQEIGAIVRSIKEHTTSAMQLAPD